MARDDAGVSSIELVVYVPLLLLLLFMGVQVGQVMLGNQAALAAAREAARVARAGGDLTAAEDRGRAYAASIGTGVLRGADVEVLALDGGLTVRATVTGDAYALVPSLGGRITQVAEGPVEVFRGDT
ncbi:TadE/TadG family type IV pilus assembly protein [Pseudokineococcus marinus]|uniref:TadE/TadG family type IV pilus assembly protein n=1 Tax=Pseudokineococcus marinus TaxID=351215 RepID=UPI001BB2DFE8|nr:TadE/TadG family type IV pilus assembly protein [Pseudokineococcus marinus]